MRDRALGHQEDPMIARALSDTRSGDARLTSARSSVAVDQRCNECDEILARAWRDLGTRMARAAATLPNVGIRISAEHALDGIALLGWPVIVSTSHSIHAAAWRDLGHAGRPPIAFREADRLRIDLARLTPTQRKRLEAPSSSSL